MNARTEAADREFVATLAPELRAMFDRYGMAYRAMIMAISVVISMCVWLPATTINVAIPQIMGSFGIEQIKAQWLSTGFLAASTGSMLLTDWLLNRWGLRLAMAGCLAIFLSASLLGGLSPSADVIIFSRLLQGAAAGPVGPLSMLLIFQVFPIERRGFAMGVMGVGIILAPAFGPTLGGLMVDSFNWRYVFFMVVPITAACIPLILIYFPGKGQGPKPSFDWPGLALLAGFLCGLLLMFSNVPREGWNSDYILFCGITAVFCGFGFIYWQLRSPHPLLELSIFRNLQFSAAAMLTFISGIGLYGSTYLLPLFVQTIQGMTPTQSGLLFVPAGVAMGLLFPIGGLLTDRFDTRWMMSAGLLLFGASMLLFIRLDTNTSFLAMALWILLGRLGLVLVLPSLTVANLAPLPPERIGQASGVSNFLRQLGGALGVNALAINLRESTDHYASILSESQTFGNPATYELLTRLPQTFTQMGLPENFQLPMAVAFINRSLWIQARMLGFRDGFELVALVFLLSLLMVFFVAGGYRSMRRPQSGSN